MQLPEALTEAQHAIWDAIVRLAGRDAAFPPPHQICTELGFKNATVRQHLEALERKGLIARHSLGVGRSPRLEFTALGRRLAGLGGFPVLGAITAGRMADGAQEPVGFLNLPGKPGWFGLRVRGDSMADLIVEGDIVILQAEAEPRPGEICAVRLDGEVTLKYFERHGKRAHLKAHNPSYPPLELPLEGLRVDGVYRGLARGELVALMMEAPM